MEPMIAWTKPQSLIIKQMYAEYMEYFRGQHDLTIKEEIEYFRGLCISLNRYVTLIVFTKDGGVGVMDIDLTCNELLKDAECRRAFFRRLAFGVY